MSQRVQGLCLVRFVDLDDSTADFSTLRTIVWHPFKLEFLAYLELPFQASKLSLQSLKSLIDTIPGRLEHFQLTDIVKRRSRLLVRSSSKGSYLS
jgi:hypothetical protein